MSAWPQFLKETLKPLLNEGKIDLALQKLSHFLTQEPKQFQAWMSAGKLLSLKNQSDSTLLALQSYQEAQKIHPRNPHPAFELCKVYLKTNSFHDAWASFKKGLFFDNRHPEIPELFRSFSQNIKMDRYQETFDIVFFTGDLFGRKLCYPDEIDSHALGGSEFMFLVMIQELANLGFKVAAFAPFEKDKSYQNWSCFRIDEFFVYQYFQKMKVCIVSRYYQPFLNHLNAEQKIFWLHDIVKAEYQNLYQKMDQQVDEYWILSQYQKQNYIKNCKLTEAKFWQTSNVIESKNFLQHIPLSDRNLHQFIYLSRPSRGLNEALLIFQKLKAEYTDAQLIVCTYSAFEDLHQDPELQDYLPLIEELGVQVRKLNKLELIAAVQKSYLVLYPNSSDLETSCLAAIESMACGTPMITQDRACLNETLINDETGIVLPWCEKIADRITQQFEACKYLIEDTKQWEKISSRAREHALQKHDSRQLALDWVSHLNLT